LHVNICRHSNRSQQFQHLRQSDAMAVIAGSCGMVDIRDPSTLISCIYLLRFFRYPINCFNM